MTIAVVVIEAGDQPRKLADYECATCPHLGDILQLMAPSGDLDFMEVVRVEHRGIELPRNFITEGKQPSVTVYVKWESRYVG